MGRQLQGGKFHSKLLKIACNLLFVLVFRPRKHQGDVLHRVQLRAKAVLLKDRRHPAYALHAAGGGTFQPHQDAQ